MVKRRGVLWPSYSSATGIARSEGDESDADCSLERATGEVRDVRDEGTDFVLRAEPSLIWLLLTGADWYST